MARQLSIYGDEVVDSEMATSDVELDVEEDAGDESLFFHAEGDFELEDHEQHEHRQHHENDDEDEVYNEDVEDVGSSDVDDDEDPLLHGLDEDEDDALKRLSQQAIRRRQSTIDYSDDEEHIEQDEDEDHDAAENYDDEDDGDLNQEIGDAVDFMRRLIRSRNTRAGEADGGDIDEDEGDEEEDDQDEGVGSNLNTRNQEFVDVIQRLMGGGGMAFGSGSSTSGGGPIRGGILGDIIGGGTGLHYEISSLIDNLVQRTDPFLILESLNELSERLLMMNGITAERVIPANKLAKALVEIMQDPQLAEDLEVHLVACRCLFNFLEVNLDFIHEALNNGAIEVLCGKLMEISYIDLTEQALQTLEMISREPVSHAKIIQSDGLRACLQYLDFFTVHAQRKALTIVANSCIGGVNVDNFEKVDGEVFHMIANVVRQHEDSVVVEYGWLAISRIILSVKFERKILEDLFGTVEGEDLLNEMVNVVVRSISKDDKSSTSSGSTVTFGTTLNIIKSLITLVSVGVGISAHLIKNKVGKTISQCLVAAGKKQKSDKVLNASLNAILNLSHTSNASEISNNISSLMSTPKELLSQFLTLIGYLLPISYDYLPFLINEPEPAEKIEIKQLRIGLCSNNEDYWNFVNDIWGLLLNAFQATMDYEIRRKILINLYRIVSFTKPGEFSKIKYLEKISGLLASVASLCTNIDEENSEIVGLQSPSLLLCSSLLITRGLVENAGAVMVESFQKEGLINDIESISEKLCKKFPHNADDDDELMSSQSLMSSSMARKFVDFEFTKSYEVSDDNTVESISKKIISLCKPVISSVSDYRVNFGDKRSNGMVILNEVIASLKSIDSDTTYEDNIQIFSRMKNSFDCGGKEEISSFELISSGIISKIVQVLQVEGDFAYQAFVEMFFKDDSISVLIAKLQDCLTRSESFEIISSSPNTNSTTQTFIGGGFGSLGLGLANRPDVNSKTASMARQIKIKLVPEEGSISLPTGMQNIIFSIHAIATFKSVDAFISHRMKVLRGFTSGSWTQEDKDSGDEDNAEDENRKDESELIFSLDDECIPKETTIYGAIYRSLQDKNKNFKNGSSDIVSKIWSTIHTVKYKRVSTKIEEINGDNEQIVGFDGSSVNYDNQEFEETTNADTLSILRLLKILFEMNSYVRGSASYKPISNNLFKNWKLTVKLNRQFEDPLVVASGTLPNWTISLPKEFPMIFPLDTRIFFLQSTSFGYSRLIHHWQLRTNQEEENERNNNAGNITQRLQLGRPARHKVRLSRKLLLQSAVKVLNTFGSTPGVLEIEYFDEVGSGLGPTLEFYSSVSKEFSGKKLMLWRNGEEAEEDNFVNNKSGLFPAPSCKRQLESENGKKILFLFNILGKFIARGMLDSRIVDFNFNPNFFKIVLFLLQNPGLQSSDGVSRFSKLSLLKQIDQSLGNSIERLLEDKESGKEVGSLGLTFELPGYSQYELIENGSDVLITNRNLELYVEKVVEATTYTGVVPQIKAFMDGFSKVFPINSLVIFSPQELISMLGSGEEDWSEKTLFSSINTDHGYTKESPAIKKLIDILTHFDIIERRLFLQFLTGAPKLPIGGFKALRPELTVVKKLAEDGLKDDDYLPSVMTCANYLKLPNYSTEDVMKQKIKQAINDGAGAFLLS